MFATGLDAAARSASSPTMGRQGMTSPESSRAEDVTREPSPQVRRGTRVPTSAGAPALAAVRSAMSALSLVQEGARLAFDQDRNEVAHGSLTEGGVSRGYSRLDLL